MEKKKQKIWREITALLNKLYDPLERDREASRIRSVVSESETEDEAISFLEEEKARLQNEMAAKPRKSSKALPWALAIGGGIFLVIVTTIVVAMALGKSQPAVATAADSSSSLTTVASAPDSSTLKDDFFKVDESATVNAFGRLFETGDVGVADDAPEVFSEDMKRNLEVDLKLAATDPEVLESVIRNALKKDIPKQMTVEVDGSLYMSMDARKLWKEYFLHMMEEYRKGLQVETAKEGTKAYMDGVDKNDNYIVSSTPLDLSGQRMLIFHDVDGNIVKKAFFCGNFVLQEVPKGTPRGEIPTPPTTASPKNIGEAPQNNPAVVVNDPQNIRPAANGPEEATVNTSPGTAYQGTPADVAAQQQQAAAAAAAAAQQQAAAAAAAAQQHQQAQQAAAAAAAAAQQQAAAAAQQAQNAQQQQAAQQQQQQVANQQQAQQQNNQGTVTGGDGW